MNIIINYANLNENELDETNEKVRAIIISEDQKLLVANYNGVLLLPGGSIDNNETLKEALLRELREELGITYYDNEIENFFTLTFYQKDYPKRNGTTLNRKITTHYYIAKFKNINYSNQVLTEKELESKFTLQFLSLSEINEYLENTLPDNPRFYYFKEEMEIILNNLEKQKNYILKK